MVPTPASGGSKPAQTRWLSAAEQAAWRAFLGVNRLLMAQLDSQMQRDSGIPLAYYEVLVRLSEAPARTLRMSELAESSQSSRSRLSHAVARMEEAGWIRREECATDRRGSFAVLTNAGFEKLAEAAPGHVACVRRHLFDPLDDEQVAALHAINAVLLKELTSDEPEGHESVNDPAAGGVAPSAETGGTQR